MGKILRFLGQAQTWIMKIIEWLGVLLHLVKEAEDELDGDEEENKEKKS